MWNKFKSFWQGLWARVYLTYALATGVNDFEPWEATLLNTMVVLTLALVSYSSWVYLPHYLRRLMDTLDMNIDSEKVVVDYPGYTSSQM